MQQYIIYLVIAIAVMLVLYLFKKNLKKTNPTHERDEYSNALTFKEFEKKAEEILRKAKADEYMLITFEIDHFADIIAGYDKANIEKILTRLTDSITPPNMPYEGVICRLEGSHYAVLAKKIEYSKLEEVFYNIPKMSIDKILVDNRLPQTTMNISAGVCYIWSVSSHLYRFMEYADIAKSSKKHIFGSTIAEFTEDMLTKQIEVSDVTKKMQQALQKRQFIPYLQPKIDLKTNNITGAEILVRWQSDTEMIAPGKFIPVMEENGFIGTLDFYMFEETCKLWRMLLKNKIQTVETLSVNLSRITLLRPDLNEKLLKIISYYQLEPGMIELEITESAFAGNVDFMTTKISSLREDGFLIAIDDFGSNYSTLTSLFAIEANVVKFDRAFTDIMVTQRGKAFLSSMIIVLQNASFKIVFEGIETSEQNQMISEYGCDIGQGYFYARPMPYSDFINLIRSYII